MNALQNFFGNVGDTVRPIVNRPNEVTSTRSALPGTLRHIESDPGTGLTVPTPAGLPSVTGIFSATENSVMRAASVANAGAWESDTSALAPSSAVLQQLTESASKGGLNSPLGSQLSFGDVPIAGDSGSASTASGGLGMVLFLGLAVVGGLLYYHFHKKHEKAAA